MASRLYFYVQGSKANRRRTEAQPKDRSTHSRGEAYEGAGASRQNLRFQAEPWMAPDATRPKASRHLLTITVILSAEGMDARSESCDRIRRFPR